MAEFSVDGGRVASLAVMVLTLGRLRQVEQALPAADVAVVGADAHRARVVDVAVQVQQRVTQHQVH